MLRLISQLTEQTLGKIDARLKRVELPVQVFWTGVDWIQVAYVCLIYICAGRRKGNRTAREK